VPRKHQSRLDLADVPETPDPDREAMRGFDDATVARMSGPSAAREIESRLRFEAAWSGTWRAGEDAPVPPPVRSMQSEIQKRKAFRELLAMTHSSNKAARDSARFLLKRDHGHSFS
jgi:hypothetical protein